MFREHFHRNRITDDDFFRQVVASTHLNPVKHGFIENFRNYPQSSFSAFLSQGKSFIDKDFVLNFFGTLNDFEAWHNQKELQVKGIIEDVQN